jgi:phage gp36-like protein
MPYANTDDILVRYRPIRSMIGSGPYDVTSTEIASVYINQVEAYINAYLGQRYVVPFTEPINPIITQVTADLSIFFILAEKLPSVPDFMDQRRQRADELLKQLANGELAIAGASQVTSAGDSFAWSPNMGHVPVFSPVLSELDQRVDRERVIEEQVLRGTNPWADCP